MQIYEADGNAYTALPGVSVSIADGVLAETDKKGKVTINTIYTGPHELQLKKDGYIPVSDIVTVQESSTKELYYVMQKDTDPNTSVITYVKNSLSDYTSGNQTVIPQGQIDDQIITFSFTKRIADGERFVNYLYRIINDEKKVKDTGEFSTDTGFYIDTAKMKAGDRLEFALVTEKNGETQISSYTDSYLTIAPPLSAVGEMRVKLQDIKDHVKSSYKLAEWEWKGEKEETTYIELFPDYTVKDDDGKKIFTRLNGIYTQENTSQWKLPIDLSYDLSGKYTFSVRLTHTMSGNGEYEKDQYYFHDLGMFDWRTKEIQKSEENNSKGIEFDFIAKFDKKRNEWVWTLDGNMKGSQKFEMPILDPVGAGVYLDIALSASESATWRLFEYNDNWIDSSAEWLPHGIWPKEANIGGEIKASAGIEAVKKALFKAGLWVKANAQIYLPPTPKLVMKANIGYAASLLYLFEKEDSVWENTWEISNKTKDAISLASFAEDRMNGSTYSLTGVLPSQFYNVNARSSDNILVDNVLLETEPLVLNMSDNTVLMVYAGNTGNTSNPAVLYYTVYDGTSWSMPEIIDSDGTPDIYPSLSSTSDGAILAWNDFASELSGDLTGLDESTIEDRIVPEIGITVANYDYRSRTWNKPVDVSVDKGVHLRPSAVKTVDGETLIAWVSNSGGSLTATSKNPDTISWVLLDSDNEMITQGILPVQGIAISSIKMGLREQNPYIAVLVDDEAGESSLYYAIFGTKDWNVLEKVNNWMGSDAAVSVLDGNSIYYENNGKIYSYDGSFSKLIYTCDEGSGDIFGLSAASLPVGTVVTWIGSVDGESVIYAGVLNSSGKITAPVRVYHTNEGTITGVSLLQSGENVSILYRMNTVNDSKWKHTIRSLSVPSGIDLSVTDGFIEHSGFLYPNANITTYVQAANLGLTSADGMQVMVSEDREGLKILHSVQTSKGSTATLQWTVPESYTGQTYYLSVSPINGTDVNASNNIVLITNPLFDLSAVSSEYIGVADGAEIFSVTVENQGLVDSEEAAIRVEDLNTDTLLKLHSIGIVQEGESVDVQIAVESENLEGHVLKFTVVHQDNELEESNNSVYAFVEHQEMQMENDPDITDLTVDSNGGLTGTLMMQIPDVDPSEDFIWLAACYNKSGKMLGAEKVQIQEDIKSENIRIVLNGSIQTGGQSDLVLKVFVLNDGLMPQCSETVFENIFLASESR